MGAGLCLVTNSGSKKVGGAGEPAHERFDTFAPEIFDWRILGQFFRDS
jgi:hypothetical protein